MSKGKPNNADLSIEERIKKAEKKLKPFFAALDEEKKKFLAEPIHQLAVSQVILERLSEEIAKGDVIELFENGKQKMRREMPFKPKEREYRSFGTYNLGESTEDENKLIIRGTPVVFDTPTCLYEYDGIKFFEKIARGAFDSADMSDFIFNLNHELTPYARNKNGSLNYSVGDTFDIEAILDGTDERHRQLYGDIKAGRIDKMSFSFTIAESSYNEETRTRTIIRVKKLYDVSAVTFPAYEQTSISARSLSFLRVRTFSRTQRARATLSNSFPERKRQSSVLLCWQKSPRSSEP